MVVPLIRLEIRLMIGLLKRIGYKRLNAPLLSDAKQYFIDTTSVLIENLNKRGNINYRISDNKLKMSNQRLSGFL